MGTSEKTIYTMLGLLLVCILGLMYVCYRHDMACVQACGTDPVDRCFPDRATCAGMEKLYMVPVK